MNLEPVKITNMSRVTIKIEDVGVFARPDSVPPGAVLDLHKTRMVKVGEPGQPDRADRLELVYVWDEPGYEVTDHTQ